MIQQDEQLQTLHEIRTIMERSSRFHSLSGLSGIFVGIFALAGAGAIQWYLAGHHLRYSDLFTIDMSAETARFLATTAAAVFGVAGLSTLYFTFLKAQKARQSVWTSQAKRLLINFCLPLGVGGAFCGVLVYHAIGYLIAPTMLLFYGLALVNASKYTYADLRSLGLCELALGLVSCFLTGYGLLAWALGFGLLHILYGGIMFYKYEKKDY